MHCKTITFFTMHFLFFICHKFVCLFSPASSPQGGATVGSFARLIWESSNLRPFLTRTCFTMEPCTFNVPVSTEVKMTGVFPLIGCALQLTGSNLRSLLSFGKLWFCFIRCFSQMLFCVILNHWKHNWMFPPRSSTSSWACFLSAVCFFEGISKITCNH